MDDSKREIDSIIIIIFIDLLSFLNMVFLGKGMIKSPQILFKKECSKEIEDYPLLFPIKDDNAISSSNLRYNILTQKKKLLFLRVCQRVVLKDHRLQMGEQDRGCIRTQEDSNQQRAKKRRSDKQ